MKTKINTLVLCTAMIMSIGTLSHADTMKQLSDDELSEAQGQALLNLGYTAPSAGGVGANTRDYGYYKMGMEAEMELNVNIKNLQLGCGGVNGANGCDIDISNLSLSGPADGKVTVGEGVPGSNYGQPTWSKGRANTSAKLTNPFVEFAVKNPNSAALREIVGFRLSAEEILGHMSAGISNDKNTQGVSTGGGINSFSGYLKVAETPVSASTQPAIFGTRADQSFSANVNISGLFDRTATSNVNRMTVGSPGYAAPDQSNTNFYSYGGSRIWGVNVPSINVDFAFPETSVTGNRVSQLDLVVRDVPIANIPIGRDSGGINLTLDDTVDLGFIGSTDVSTFFMGANNAQGTYAACAAGHDTNNCTYITNLKANVRVLQNFNLVHNLPITSGAYLSLQKEAIRWPGSSSAYAYDLTTQTSRLVADDYVPTATEVMNYGDVAQPGWWLSFADPLDFGALNPQANIDMADVLPQIASFITDSLSQSEVEVGLIEGLQALTGAPLYKALGDIQLPNSARAVMVLENLLLDGHQNPVGNCWGNLKFC